MSVRKAEKRNERGKEKEKTAASVKQHCVACGCVCVCVPTSLVPTEILECRLVRGRGKINNVNSGHRGDSKRSGRWRLSMQIPATEPAIPSLAFFCLFIFRLSRALDERDATWRVCFLGRGIDSPYYLRLIEIFPTETKEKCISPGALVMLSNSHFRTTSRKASWILEHVQEHPKSSRRSRITRAFLPFLPPRFPRFGWKS